MRESNWFRIVTVISMVSWLLAVPQSFHTIPDEKWGYENVREGAYMFWWLYGSYKQPRENVPLVMWLQGGPGGSSCGFGNFAEMGPLDTSLKPRNTTWVQNVNMLFVDNPVGSGFSYVADPRAFTTNVTQIADDLFTFFSAFLSKMPVFQQIPFYIFTESYGGKMTAAFGTRLLQGIQAREINCNFKGVALGDSWISPVDSVMSWGPYLYSYNLLDDKDLDSVMTVATECSDAVAAGQYDRATDLWDELENIIDQCTDSVNIYNVLQHHASTLSAVSKYRPADRQYIRHVGVYYQDPLSDLMNGPIREKLGIIPDNVSWGGQSNDVFQNQRIDFMKHNIFDVDTLLRSGLNVTVYQGQLDIICDTPGAEMWIHKLAWPGLSGFYNATRKPLYVDGLPGQTQAFLKSYSNFQLFYILNAGHMVPTDNGPMALKMMRMVTGT